MTAALGGRYRPVRSAATDLPATLAGPWNVTKRHARPGRRGGRGKLSVLVKATSPLFPVMPNRGGWGRWRTLLRISLAPAILALVPVVARSSEPTRSHLWPRWPVRCPPVSRRGVLLLLAGSPRWSHILDEPWWSKADSARITALQIWLAHLLTLGHLRPSDGGHGRGAPGHPPAVGAGRHEPALPGDDRDHPQPAGVLTAPFCPTSAGPDRARVASRSHKV